MQKLDSREGWAGVKKDSFEKQYCRRALRVPWTTRKMNKWVLEPSKPETSLETKVTTLKLSFFGHITKKQGSLEKTIMVGKIEGSRKRKTKHDMDWLQKQPWEGVCRGGAGLLQKPHWAFTGSPRVSAHSAAHYHTFLKARRKTITFTRINFLEKHLCYNLRENK